MGAEIVCYILSIWLFSCSAELTFADSSLRPGTLSNTSDTNITSNGGGTNSSLAESSNGRIDLSHETAGNSSSPETFQITQNTSNPSSHLTSNEMGSSTTVGSSGSLSATPNMPSLISDANNTTHGWNANSTDWLDSSENLGTSTFSSLPGWTTPENITNVNKDNLINDKIWKPTKLENTSAGDDIAHETRVGEKDHQKDFENKNNFGAANKLLALFLGMAGVLACLFILVYCIYSRQHKEDMFSHHRLYGEGFEDPVLHLDTPVDHYDFFSFRDTDMTPAQTPRHKCKNTVAYELKSDCSIEVPQGTSSNEYLRQVIQMGSLNSTSIGKNVT